MCATNSPSVGQRSESAAKAAVVPTKRGRRSKPRNRKKPKYLSLKLELSTKGEEIKEEEAPPPSPPLIHLMTRHKKKRNRLINLFSLRPERLVPDDHKVVDLQDDQHHVALLFETATNDVTSSTLDGLLDSSTTATLSEERDPLSPSLSCVHSCYQLSDLQTDLSRRALSVESCGGGGGDGGASSWLLRMAIRCKDRVASKEERWVSYNEVVEGRKNVKREADQEVSSCCGTDITEDDDSWVKVEKVQPLVGLKLDNYQDILDAWSDKGPFCLKGEREDKSLPHTVPGVLMEEEEGWGSLGNNIWRVPEVEVGETTTEKEKENKQSGRNKSEQREASMLRYKEKRQSRLFSKRIRYHVRKLNAEKRPRLKGRFVKRNGEVL